MMIRFALMRYQDEEGSSVEMRRRCHAVHLSPSLYTFTDYKLLFAAYTVDADGSISRS